MHACTGHRLVAVHQILALAEGIEKDRHRADVERVCAEPQEVIQDAGDLVEQYADVLRALGHLDAEQPLDRHHVGMFVDHHRHVVEAIHVGDGLDEGLVLGQFLGGAMQQADVRIGTLDHLAVQFQHQAQHAVRGRMLGAEIHRVVADFRHQRSPP